MAGANYFRSYLERLPPQNLGTVEWPQAREGALQGKNFLITGVLETIEKNDINGILRDSGAHLMSTVSPKLTYLIVGRDAGPAKLQKATEKDIPTIDEGGFFQWLTDTLNNYDEDAPKSESGDKPKKAAAKPKASKVKADSKPPPAKKAASRKKKASKSDSDDDSEDDKSTKAKKVVKNKSRNDGSSDDALDRLDRKKVTAKKSNGKKPTTSKPSKKVKNDTDDSEEDVKPTIENLGESSENNESPIKKTISKKHLKEKGKAKSAESTSQKRPTRAVRSKASKLVVDMNSDSDSEF